jgi:hypothetical protein
MSWARVAIAGGLLTLLLAPAYAQRQHDPLNPAEVDQLRDTAMDPDLRLKLYVKFARARLASLEQARSDPKTKDRAQETHDLLEDFLDVYDELDENIDTYVGRKSDLRKVLKAVIEADTEFEAKLRALLDAANAAKEETKQYEFVLSNSLETVDKSSRDHRQLLAEQEETLKHKKPAAKP